MDNLVREYIDSGNRLHQKYNDLRFGKLSKDVDMVEKYNPLVEPLQKLVSERLVKNDESPDSEMKKLGGIAFEYLQKLYSNVNKVDKSFGIRVENGKLYIGKDPITILNNNIIFKDGEKFEGTLGLWELLILEKPQYFGDNDLKEYEKIVLRSCTYKHNNDPFSRAIKSSKSYKYRHIIKPMLKKPDTSYVQGSGLSKISINNPVEYVYWNTLEELLDRLCILHGEVKSGNTNPALINEIANIIQEFKEL